MSESVSHLLFRSERKAWERVRRDIAADPAELAEHMLVTFAMGIDFLRETAETSHSAHMIQSWPDAPRYRAATSRSLMVHQTLFGEGLDAYLFEDSSSYSVPHLVRHHESAALIFGKLAAEEEPWRELESIGALINRAAELLAVRHRHGQHESMRHYVSTALEARRAADQAEVDRNLAISSRNRRAMAALLAQNWLGYRLLSELGNLCPMSVSDLALAAEANIDSAATVLAKLATGGLVEVHEDSFFVCTSRGKRVLESLENAVDSAAPQSIQEAR